MIYHVFANRSNIGDWLSAKGIQKLLSPFPVTECLCDEPFIPETMAILSKAKPDDFIVIGGGGLLMDYFEPFWKAFVPVSRRVPYCLWGIGYCDNKHGLTLPSTELIEGIVNQSKLCVVRDEMSRIYLKHCKLPPPVICPSVMVLQPPENKGTGLLHVANYASVGEKIYETMRQYTQEFAQKTGRVFRETSNRITKDSAIELADCLLRYEKSDLVISSGLHGCIIGLCMGLNVLAVSADRKIDEFMQSVGLNDWVLDAGQVDSVQQRLTRLHKQNIPQVVIQDSRKKHLEIAAQVKRLAGGE